MFKLFKSKREPYDFAMILGSCTDDGRKVGALWDNVNLADSSNERGQELAKYFIDFHKGLLGVSNMKGLLEPSASLANYRALELAREATGKNKVLCSNLAHVSITEAVRSLKLEAIVLDVDPSDCQVSEEKIFRAINEHGKDIAVVVSTYGTTQLGHRENLAENDLIKQLISSGVWLHVDAAYGGYLGRLSRYIKGNFPDADSITIDPYKFLGKPGTALLLVEENQIQPKNISYYVHSPYTMHTTLSAGPVAAWGQTVKDHGDIYGLQQIADHFMEIANSTGRELLYKKVPLIHFPEMTIIPVALDSREKVDYVHKQLFDDGFSVGKVGIQGKDYEINGIRIVITPKVNPDLIHGTALQLVGKIAKLLNV